MMLLVTDDPYAVAAASAARLTSLTGRPDVAVVLGSGWAPAADVIGTVDAQPEPSTTATSGLPIREVSRAALAAATAYGSSVTSSIMAHVRPARARGRHFRCAGTTAR